ncbi:hypothetical protein M569_13756 [Genlisea aurea]|uniref:Transposase MuDR plant domain-containing protein n=1 Tax=Genlisea aurea TaxID=192259 RepID=S8C316_9LAMI|nr:hypothetical protein M569_13756 [Genlisea aurea]
MGFEIFVESTALQMPVEDEENDDVPELECNDMIFDHLENQDTDYDSQGQEPENDSDGSYGDNDEEIAHDEEIRGEAGGSHWVPPNFISNILVREVHEPQHVPDPIHFLPSPFSKNQRFASKEAFHKEVVDYSLKIGREFRAYKVRGGVCAEYRCYRRNEQGCNWRIRCAYHNRDALWKITALEEPHICTTFGRNVVNHRNITPLYIAECARPYLETDISTKPFLNFFWKINFKIRGPWWNTDTKSPTPVVTVDGTHLYVKTTSHGNGLSNYWIDILSGIELVALSLIVVLQLKTQHLPSGHSCQNMGVRIGIAYVI